MAFNPALTCWTAWLPVMAPSAGMNGSPASCNRFQSRSAPWRARVCSIWNEPRRRLTSCWVYGRVIPRHRGLVCQLLICELLVGELPFLPLEVDIYLSPLKSLRTHAVDAGLHLPGKPRCPSGPTGPK